MLTQLFQNLSRRVHLSLHGQGGKLGRKKNSTDFINLYTVILLDGSYNSNAMDEMKY